MSQRTIKIRKTMTMVVPIVLIIVGVYFFWSYIDEDNSYKNLVDDGGRMAPGTILTYEMSMELDGSLVTGISTFKIVAQNANGYMYQLSYDLRYSDGTSYHVEDRYRLTNDGSTESVNSGIGNVSTIDGKFKMPYVEYFSSGKLYRDYYNPYTDMMYLSVTEDSSSRAELISIEAVWQKDDEFTPSAMLGRELTYSLSGMSNGVAVSGTYIETIVAEDSDGNFGIRSMYNYGDYSNVSYSVSGTESADLRRTGSTTFNTMDGLKNVSVFTLSINGTNFTYYIDSEGTCYRIVLTAGTESLTMNLTSQRIDNSFVERD